MVLDVTSVKISPLLLINSRWEEGSGICQQMGFLFLNTWIRQTNPSSHTPLLEQREEESRETPGVHPELPMPGKNPQKWRSVNPPKDLCFTISPRPTSCVPVALAAWCPQWWENSGSPPWTAPLPNSYIPHWSWWSPGHHQLCQPHSLQL